METVNAYVLDENRKFTDKDSTCGERILIFLFDFILEKTVVFQRNLISKAARTKLRETWNKSSLRYLTVTKLGIIRSRKSIHPEKFEDNIDVLSSWDIRLFRTLSEESNTLSWLDSRYITDNNMAN